MNEHLPYERSELESELLHLVNAKELRHTKLASLILNHALRQSLPNEVLEALVILCREIADQIKKPGAGDEIDKVITSVFLSKEMSAERDILQAQRDNNVINLYLMGHNDTAQNTNRYVAAYKSSFLAIPAGHFFFGNVGYNLSYENESEFLSPILLPYTFEMSKYPVLVQDYAKFVLDGGYEDSSYWTKKGQYWRDATDSRSPKNWDQQNSSEKQLMPVEGINFFEAVAYCRWFSSKDKKHQYRLPTEVEWEKAARGGLDINGDPNPDALRLWAGGSEWTTSLANTLESKTGRVLPVNQLTNESNSPYGVVGMCGNLFEWTLSPPQPYPFLEESTEETSSLRIAKGGSYPKPARDARISYRSPRNPVDATYMSFRLIRTRLK